ncbi:hypothetical protein N7475_000003 [Penicillium sp. IBT 31633x]|nr:hypothetical protein N7475_000003 [Penicillium sp. IBT 31633x]
MTSFNIFHEPSFAQKLWKISSLSQLTALLAAIAGYASRFLAPKANISPPNEPRAAGKMSQDSEIFSNLAFAYVNKALVECDDEMPPLCVLQALIVATHCQLTRGVRGKAWRSLGLCVTLAYERNLHLLDSQTVGKSMNTSQWQMDEEQRRAFWAIWEMDVFASTIRRTPTAIDWHQMEIFLPVDNAHWFRGKLSPSCFMDPDPNQSWKALKDSGNKSPKAWFLVINSLMKTAQSISDQQWLSKEGNNSHYQSNNSNPGSVEEARQKLEILANAVRCFSLALPDQLNYHDEYLSFGEPLQGQLESQRQQHCSIYNIFVMTQLARLMIHRSDALRPQSRRSDFNGSQYSDDFDCESLAQRQYYEAADRILRIVSQSCEEHIQHINPFLSSTIWLASAVQLVRKHFTQAPSTRALIKSRFDVLYLTYRRCIDFWDTQTALQRNLESLEEQLETHKEKLNPCGSQDSKDTSKSGMKNSRVNHPPSSDQQIEHTKRHSKRKRTPQRHSTHTRNQGNVAQSPAPGILKSRPTQYLPDAPTAALDGSGMGQTAQSCAKYKSAVAEDAAILQTMPLPQVDRSHSSETYMRPMNSDFFDPTHLGGVHHDQGLEWPNFDLAGSIQDLLAGWTSY